MQADLPHTLYLSDRKRKGKKHSRTFRFNENDPAIQRQMEANRRKAERSAAKQRGEIPYTTEKLFK